MTKAFVISIIKIHSRIYTRCIKRRERDDKGRIGEKVRDGRADGGIGNRVSETCKTCAARLRQIRDDEEEISGRARLGKNSGARERFAQISARDRQGGG